MIQEKAKIYHELLVLQAQSGDREAFETLVGLWQKTFYSYARKFTGSEQAAWDIQQETWLAVIRQLSKLSHPAKFKSWAFAILNRRCIDHLRKVYCENSMKRTYARQFNDSNDRVCENDWLQEKFLKLDPDQRTLLLLRFNQNMTIFEIAQIMRIPEGTVKSRLHRTLAELKTKLSGDLS
jgi:RNA polymerase sigma-70 factor (ECF subfamily)